MRGFSIRQTRLVLFLVIVSMLTLLAACNTSTEDGSQNTESQSNQGDGLPAESSGDEVRDDSGNSEFSPADVVPTYNDDSQVEESQQVSVSDESDQGNSLIEIDPDTIEVDINGVTVGFTTDGHPFRGDPLAPVLIEEYSDFQCPYCSRFYKQTLSQLDANQFTSGEALLVYYDFPLVRSHPQAIAAANAARCAGEQGAINYWLMHDLLFQNPNEWSNQNYSDTFMNYAENIGLELAAFSKCLSDNRYDTEIDADLNKGAAQGISGTPSFIINGELLVGAQPVEVFNAAISALEEGGTLAVTGSDPQPSQPAPAVAPTPAVYRGVYRLSMPLLLKTFS
jgi:protein-disulfide isomerase